MRGSRLRRVWGRWNRGLGGSEGVIERVLGVAGVLDIWMVYRIKSHIFKLNHMIDWCTTKTQTLELCNV